MGMSKYKKEAAYDVAGWVIFLVAVFAVLLAFSVPDKQPEVVSREDSGSPRPVTTQVSVVDAHPEVVQIPPVAPIMTEVVINLPEPIEEEEVVPELDIAAICSGFIAEAEKLEFSNVNKKTWAVALEYWEVAVQADPNNYIAWVGLTNNLGTFFYREFKSDFRNRPEGYTLDYYEESVWKLIALRPHEPLGFNALAYCAAFRGDTSVALEYLEESARKEGDAHLKYPENYQSWCEYMRDTAKRANKIPDDWIDLDEIRHMAGSRLLLR